MASTRPLCTFVSPRRGMRPPRPPREARSELIPGGLAACSALGAGGQPSGLTQLTAVVLVAAPDQSARPDTI